MAGMETALQTQRLACETLRSYADVLRLGHLTVNGRDVFWDTRAPTGQQLQNYCTALAEAFRTVPHLHDVDEDVLCQVPYLLCKALSINYALSEVLALLRQRLGDRRGTTCSIRTSGDGGKSLVDYGIDFRPDGLLHAHLSWRGRGNIVSCNPQSGAKKVRGSLFSVETEFPLAPCSDFMPAYRLHMDLRPFSRASQFTSAVASKVKGPRQVPVETMRPGQPLSLECFEHVRSVTKQAKEGAEAALPNLLQRSPNPVKCMLPEKLQSGREKGGCSTPRVFGQRARQELSPQESSDFDFDADSARLLHSCQAPSPKRIRRHWTLAGVRKMLHLGTKSGPSL